MGYSRNHNNRQKGGKGGDKPAKAKDYSAKAGKNRRPTNKVQRSKDEPLFQVPPEMIFVEGGLEALLALPKDTQETHVVVSDANGFKATFRAVGGTFRKKDEDGKVSFVPRLEIYLHDAEPGNILYSLPECAKEIYITPGQIMAFALTRNPTISERIWETRLALREYLRQNRGVSAVVAAHSAPRNRRIPALLQEIHRVEPSAESADNPPFAKLQVLREKLAFEKERKNCSSSIAEFKRQKPGKYRFPAKGPAVYVELKPQGRQVRVEFRAVDEGNALFGALNLHVGVGFSFDVLEGKANLPLGIREGNAPAQIAVKTLLEQFQKFLKQFDFQPQRADSEKKEPPPESEKAVAVNMMARSETAVPSGCTVH